jgi:hypothetical protein
MISVTVCDEDNVAKVSVTVCDEGNIVTMSITVCDGLLLGYLSGSVTAEGLAKMPVTAGRSHIKMSVTVCDTN